MSWLPRITMHGWTLAEDDGEVEGACISLCWGRLVIELAFGRYNGRFR